MPLQKEDWRRRQAEGAQIRKYFYPVEDYPLENQAAEYIARNYREINFDDLTKEEQQNEILFAQDFLVAQGLQNQNEAAQYAYETSLARTEPERSPDLLSDREPAVQRAFTDYLEYTRTVWNHVLDDPTYVATQGQKGRAR